MAAEKSGNAAECPEISNHWLQPCGTRASIRRIRSATPLSVRTMTLRRPDHPYDDGPARAVSASVVPGTRWR